MIIAEYIWLDSNSNFRSKTRVIYDDIKEIEISDIPLWNFDGSSTNQATTENSEVILKPVFFCKDPFRDIKYGRTILVLCELWTSENKPHTNNTRYKSKFIFDKYSTSNIKFGLEQEFFFLLDGKSLNDYPDESTEEHYCMGKRLTSKEHIEEAFQLCLSAELKVTGMNSEVAEHQWEIQICQYGIQAADELHMVRYILNRVADKHGYLININPKPFSNWNGSGCHINFSTNKMRENNSEKKVNQIIEKLKNKHDFHIENYGDSNHMRLTGLNETSCISNFTSGIGDRTASIRIPTNTFTYIEDRRPASNIDPYIATSIILQTISE